MVKPFTGGWTHAPRHMCVPCNLPQERAVQRESMIRSSLSRTQQRMVSSKAKKLMQSRRLGSSGASPTPRAAWNQPHLE